MDLLRGGEPIEVRHAHVEQNEIGADVARQGDSAGPITGDPDNRVPEGAKVLFEAERGDALIFTDENAEGRSGHQGS
jgi:hypothetical protein